MAAAEMQRVRVDIEKERGSLSSANKNKKSQRTKYEQQLNRAQQKSKQYNAWHETSIRNNRERYNASVVDVLEGSVSHSMLQVVEYASSIDADIPVMYIGFEHIEEMDPSLSLYEHGQIKYQTLSASKYRYMFEFDSFEIAVAWERMFTPWMSELKKDAST